MSELTDPKSVPVSVAMGEDRLLSLCKLLRPNKARFFLLVDLREFFSDLGSGGGDEKYKEKSSENDKLTGHFQSFFFMFRAFFFR